MGGGLCLLYDAERNVLAIAKFLLTCVSAATTNDEAYDTALFTLVFTDFSGPCRSGGFRVGGALHGATAPMMCQTLRF